MNTIVLGAGIAGLGYAANADKLERVTVYEKNDTPGGLCRSFHKNGFTFDSAVHLSFTTRDEARTFFDQTEYVKRYPEAYNFFKGLYIKHPVIYNLFPFEADFKCKCIEDFVERDKLRIINNYADWLESSYGNELKEKFYDIYTRKYWTVPSQEMSTTWIGIRLQNPDFHKILFGAFSENTGNNYYAREMRYPVDGGYQSFLKPLIKKSDIQTDKEAIKIDTKYKIIYFLDGSSSSYDKLVSSIPLPALIEIMQDVPNEVELAAKKLTWSKVSIVTFGFKKPEIAKYLWMYIYDEDILAARINSPSLKSSNNVPNGCSSLQFEIYHNNKDSVDESKVMQNTLDAIVKMGIAKTEDICFTDYRLLPFGNVLFYNGMEDDRKIVKDYLEGLGIVLIGRFGEWDYLWSDQSYLSGKHATENNK